MQNDRLNDAMDRIDAALSRIETATANAPVADMELAERHDALRTRVTTALIELDGLIEGIDA